LAATTVAPASEWAISPRLLTTNLHPFRNLAATGNRYRFAP